MIFGVLTLGDAPNDLAPKVPANREHQECDWDHRNGTVPKHDHDDAEKRGRDQAPTEHAIDPHEALLAPCAGPFPLVPLACEILHPGLLTLELSGHINREAIDWSA